jgi:hypothetical protein
MSVLHLNPRPALTHPLALGVGWNCFDYFGTGGVYGRNPEYPLSTPVMPDLDDAAGWRALVQALDHLRPGVIRFGLPPNPHCDAAGRFRPGTVHLERLRRLDAWATANGATLVLDPFLIPEAHESQPVPARRAAMLNLAPADNDRYARDFAAPLLRWCVDQGLRSVQWFNPVNEPLHWGVFETVGPDDDPDAKALRAYVDLYRALRAACDEAGVSRQRIGLLGMDGYDFDNLLLLRMHALGLDLDPWVDGYSVHYYNHRLDREIPSASGWTQPIALTMDERAPGLVEYCRRRGKPLFAMEIGSFHHGWRNGDPAGPATHACCLTVAEAVIRGLKAGLGGFAFWSLLNSNDVDGWFRAFAIEGGRLRPADAPWHVYGLLSRHARPGAKVLPFATRGDLCPGRVHAVGLENSDGTRVLLAVNDDAIAPASLVVELPHDWPLLGWRHSATDQVRRSEAMPVPQVEPDGSLRVLLSPMSVNALYAVATGTTVK